jgi:hypothetical protein
MTGRRVGRRSATAGGFAMLVLAASAAGSAKAEELDGKLIRLCNEGCDIHAGSVRIELEHEARGLEAPFETVIWPRTARWHELCQQIVDAPARTPEGMRAKARVLAVSGGALRASWTAAARDGVGACRSGRQDGRLDRTTGWSSGDQ